MPEIPRSAAGDPIASAMPHENSATSAGARYRMMSPPGLPITRSPCLTIPPGFSPSSLLESPVLLTNMKTGKKPVELWWLLPITRFGCPLYDIRLRKLYATTCDMKFVIKMAAFAIDLDLEYVLTLRTSHFFPFLFATCFNLFIGAPPISNLCDLVV